MKTWRSSVWLLTLLVAACSVDDGTDGAAGAPGANAVDTGTIAGIVIDATGAPLSGASVETTPATSVRNTAANGRFEFLNIPVGAYTISASATGYNPGHGTAGVAGGRTTNVSLTLVPVSTASAGRIDGKVVDVTGRGIAGVAVGGGAWQGKVASNLAKAVLVNASSRLVGAPRFELGTPCTPCKCATRLRHAPTGENKPRGGVGSAPGVDDSR